MTTDKNATVDELKTALAGVKQHMSISLATAVILKKKMVECAHPSAVCMYADQLAEVEDRIAKGLPQSFVTKVLIWSFAFMVCSACVSVGIWLIAQALRLSGIGG